MAKYAVVFIVSAEKEFAKLDKVTQARILRAVEKMETNPRPQGCKKLKGSPYWRIRIGDFRVIYQIFEDIVQIDVVKIGHRKEVYD